VEVHGTALEGTILICTDGLTYQVGECADTAPPVRLFIPFVAAVPAD
jgi:hypothetical protein